MEKKIEALPSKYRTVITKGKWRWIALLLPTIAILIALINWYYISPFGFVFYELSFLFALIGCFLPLTYLWVKPTTNSSSDIVPWYDIVLAIISFLIPLYFIIKQDAVALGGWDINAPPLETILGGFLWILVLEGVRRTTGWILTGVITVFSTYPLWASHMPIDALWGPSYSLDKLISIQIISTQGLLGIVMDIFGELILGFMVFAAVVSAFGAGKLFNDLALALVSKSRGGPAKVAVISSGFFASINGSVAPNVMTTGPFTIPAMKKAGYSAAFAGGVEAAASSGGTLMPPVMGAAAFIMAEFLKVPYSHIVKAAIVPAILYFVCLYAQIDARARRNKLPILESEYKPNVLRVLWEHLHIFIGIAILLFFLFFMRVQAQAPYYASLVIFLLGMLTKQYRLNFKGFVDLIISIGKTLADLVPTLAGVGLLVGALNATGLSLSLPYSIIALAGDSTILMLIIGAVVAIILGMGMSVSAVYIFLALLLAPGLVQAGINPMAAHLFILYFGMISSITPPVALGAIVAAPIAGAPMMKVAFEAMKLGGAIYIVPFVFAFNPALILIGSFTEIIWVVVTAIIGLIYLGAAFEGYLWLVGNITILSRIVIGVISFVLIMPNLIASLIALALLLVTIVSLRAIAKRKNSITRIFICE